MKPPTKNLLRGALAATAAGLVALLPLSGTASASPQSPLSGHAHRTVTTDAGETFELRLGATPTVLPADGGTAYVGGTGYNRAQGIFLAFCVIPDSVKVGDPSTYTEKPGPCLGGRESTDGSGRRITDTGTGTPGVTIPYEEGGSFRTTLNLRPEIADGVVCDVTVKCAIVTRADFTATDNRLYDQYIPVRFASDSTG
ncbi:hypothetical protein [Streptomyces fulvoviolaceus]|uniref:hypothetical protein n=1 Tax=Streptomyces fulvoviolaceus TaxID=285535 RepID=UPI0004CB100D|nr:hypothetical protein [Streptomyces fulvoviolaceus]MCT9082848.1 hypothetical protein [Streptomyces fulvoviolaceus]